MPRLFSKVAIQVAASGLGRGAALFLGLFTLCNLLGEWRHPGFDATLWWIDLRRIGRAAPGWLLVPAAALCLRFACGPTMGPRLRIALQVCLGLLMAVSVDNAIVVWRLQHSGQIQMLCPIPFSVIMLGMLASIGAATLLPPQKLATPWVNPAIVSFGMLCCGLLFLVGQMVCFGWTDYRRQADVAVVFGCRVFSDGSPSQALFDRVCTAADLYHERLVKTLILSGGPGDRDVHETLAMERLATRFGVDPADILIDHEGLNTEATVRNALGRFSNDRPTRILAVSHFYHLPRIKLCFHRNGAEVYTVPAREQHLLRGLSKYMAREIAALLWYYVSPVIERPGTNRLADADAADQGSGGSQDAR